MRETIFFFFKVSNHAPDDEEHIAERGNFRWHFETRKDRATLGNIQQKFQTNVN